MRNTKPAIDDHLKNISKFFNQEKEKPLSTNAKRAVINAVLDVFQGKHSSQLSLAKLFGINVDDDNMEQSFDLEKGKNTHLALDQIKKMIAEDFRLRIFDLETAQFKNVEEMFQTIEGVVVEARKLIDDALTQDYYFANNANGYKLEEGLNQVMDLLAALKQKLKLTQEKIHCK